MSLLANIITLGVRDFASARGFYLRLGWPLAFDSEDFALFDLRGVLLALFPATQLAAEVDAMVALFRDAGGSVSKEPTDAEFFAGRSAYVSDPESNFWEITWAESGNRVVAAARRAAALG